MILLVSHTFLHSFLQKIGLRRPSWVQIAELPWGVTLPCILQFRCHGVSHLFPCMSAFAFHLPRHWHSLCIILALISVGIEPVSHACITEQTCTKSHDMFYFVWVLVRLGILVALNAACCLHINEWEVICLPGFPALATFPTTPQKKSQKYWRQDHSRQQFAGLSIAKEKT